MYLIDELTKLGFKLDVHAWHTDSRYIELTKNINDDNYSYLSVTFDKDYKISIYKIEKNKPRELMLSVNVIFDEEFIIKMVKSILEV